MVTKHKQSIAALVSLGILGAAMHPHVVGSHHSEQS